MRPFLTRNEAVLVLACAALCAIALWAPALVQPPHAHDFADRRTLLGIPHAFDVLSNLPFAIAGAWGLLALRQVPAGALPTAQRRCARVFFFGLLLTAAGSAWYHLAPVDAGLAIDRAAMGVAFAGLLGLLAAIAVSERAGHAMATILLVLAPASVFAWLVTANVLPWALVQFGGIALMLLMLALPRGTHGRLHVQWSLVLLAYAAAKLLEANDAAVYAATGGLLSGHTLKHIAAAFAAWPVIAALPRPGQRQNGRNSAAQTA